MRKTIFIGLLIIMLAVINLSCRKNLQIVGLDLEVTFSESPLSDGLITDMQYTWKTSDNFEKMKFDYNIFVHFWHNKNMLFQDDHIPEIQTSEWEAGKEYTYSRRIYIPEFIDKSDSGFKGFETLKLSIGLYSPYDRTGKSQQKIFDEKQKVYPPPLNTPKKTCDKGWHNLENNPDTFLKQWRWTEKEARCIIDNPRRDALLIIKGGINPNVHKDQKIIFKINDWIVDEFVPESVYFDKSYSIEKEKMGEEDKFILIISTDKSFIPAQIIPDSKDDRELGVMISYIYFR